MIERKKERENDRKKERNFSDQFAFTTIVIFFGGGGLIPFVRRHVNAADIFFSASIAVEFLQRKLLDIVEKIFHWLML